MTTEIRRRDVGLRSERGPILGANMISLALVALDGTILATAVPTVVDDLGGLALVPWLFSIYFLTNAVAVPVYGKLADMVGRKPIMLMGIGVFTVASVLCGLAWSLPALIVFRGLQGLGGGAVQPMSMTIMGDIYSVAERAKAQAYIAVVFIAGSVVGPTLGGLFSDFLSWRGVFFINLPLGALAMVMLQRNFHETVTRRKHRMDYLGAVLLTIGGTLLLVALSEGGLHWGWGSPQIVTMFAVAAAAFAAFLATEYRAAEPLVPLRLLRNRPVMSAVIAGGTAMWLLTSLTTYVPLYAQGVLGHTATVAGLAVAAISLGWPVATAFAGRFYLSVGFRRTMAVGAVGGLAGSVLLALIAPGWGVVPLTLVCFLLGFSFGVTFNPGMIAAQASVTWHERGAATGLVMFVRAMCSVTGVAVCGAIANGYVAAHNGGTVPRDLSTLPVTTLEPALHLVFLSTALVLLVLGLSVWVMPRHPAVEGSSTWTSSTSAD